MKLPAIIVTIACLAGLVGCGRADLSRTEAAAAIEVSEEIKQRTIKIDLHPQATAKLDVQGFRSRQTKKDLLYSVISEEVTSGKSSWFILRSPTTIYIDATGIADVPGSVNLKEAQFRWRYEELPSLVKRFAVEGGTGKATFRLFDDGWRLEGVETKSSGTPVVLSAQERSDEAADEMNEVALRKQDKERLTKLLAESRTPKETYLSRRTTGIFGRYRQIITITDVDVTYILLCTGSGPECNKQARVWYGDIIEVNNRYANQSVVSIAIRNRGWSWGLEVGSPEESTEVAQILASAINKWRVRYAELLQ